MYFQVSFNLENTSVLLFLKIFHKLIEFPTGNELEGYILVNAVEQLVAFIPRLLVGISRPHIGIIRQLTYYNICYTCINLLSDTFVSFNIIGVNCGINAESKDKACKTHSKQGYSNTFFCFIFTLKLIPKVNKNQNAYTHEH